MAVKATYQPGGDQDPPGDTWRHPKPPKKILLNKIWATTFVTKICLGPLVKSSKTGTIQYYSP